ncbi:MAG: hypothetical protein KGD57_08645 [Candidatus Lokiarchaeota archaeon]|nr:hypothetical protein [Candidatus Lokiarchaeota archaeon]
MEIELISEFIYKNRVKNENKSIRLPNEVKSLEIGNYLIKIYKLELEG